MGNTVHLLPVALPVSSYSNIKAIKRTTGVCGCCSPLLIQPQMKWFWQEFGEKNKEDSSGNVNHLSKPAS
jgi:hypothetical protein